MRKLIVAFVFTVVAALPAHPQGPPFVAGLQLPSKVAFTRHRNLVVAESGMTVDGWIPVDPLTLETIDDQLARLKEMGTGPFSFSVRPRR